MPPKSKEDRAAYMREYRKKPENLEKHREMNRQYAAEHRGEALERATSYYQKNKEKVLTKMKDARHERKLIWSYQLGGKCVECGFDDIRALQFHHREPETKVFAIASAVSSPSKFTEEEIADELRKCDLLCANCHSIKHNGWFTGSGVAVG